MGFVNRPLTPLCLSFFPHEHAQQRIASDVHGLLPVRQNVEERVSKHDEANTSVQRHTVEQTVEILARQFVKGNR